jgi:hypothetical protein
MTDLVEYQAGVPAGILETLDKSWDSLLEGVGGAFRSIAFKGNRFHIRENGQSVVYKDASGRDATFMDWIILNTAPKTHCVYYAEKFDASKVEVGAKPTNVWWSDAPIPAGVPAVKDAQGRWKFQTKLRLVVSPLHTNADGQLTFNLNHVYVVDLAAQSLFGKSEGERVGFFALLDALRKSNLKPYRLAIRTFFSEMGSVPSLRFAPSFIDRTTGQPSLFPADFLATVAETAVRQDTLRLLNPIDLSVNRTGAPLDEFEETAPPAPVAQAPVAPPAPVAQSAPTAYVAQTFVAPVAPVAPASAVDVVAKAKAATQRAKAAAKNVTPTAPVYAPSNVTAASAPVAMPDLGASVRNLINLNAQNNS